ncbi:hypothetical protein GCL60_09580 [Silvanigrella paludirubra]|jgi:hypothetical protein|uniref:Macro domain-containing protein n=1 Tax=Silvanigrella paludirubra TaxID=2499159 RepID=A0A6N6VYA5_9BACT|nr:hypothetical protein [Silvanigrella paludirubra]KAB8039095.1 hypothetical protein GCL60_09580 [Silvanigrella paludirubra]
MIFQFVDNIFDLYPEALAHPINSIGLSHDLLTKKIKKIWPDYYREYARSCLRKHFEPYQSYYYPINTLFGTNHIIAMTIRNNWQERLKQDTMRKTILSLIDHCNSKQIMTLAIPIIENVPQKWIEQEIELATKNFSNINLKIVYIFENN